MSVSNYYDHSDPTTALKISQKAPTVLSKSSLVPSSLPWSIVAAAETPEEWGELEQTFYACLRTQDDKSAHLCLERMMKRFGAGNQRVVAMRGLYQEAIAKDDAGLRAVLQEYNKILEQNPMNVPVHKRRIALIRSIGREEEAIMSLVAFLESFPTDTEAWCELSDLYHSQGLLAQAIFCLEEALLTVSNAWNLHARLGELNFMASQAGSDSSEAGTRYLVDAIHRFSRSIELCDNYLRGYYGLKLSTDSALKSGKKLEPSISQEQIRKLNELATRKLKMIVQQWTQNNAAKSSESEVIAAQALLDRQK